MTHSLAKTGAAPALRQRDARKRATRTDLLRRASARVRRVGFSGLKTADVAKDAGLSHGALFVHFSTRDRLLREVAEMVCRTITDALYHEAAAGADLRTSLTAHVAAIAEHEVEYRSLLVEASRGGVLLDAWTGLQSAVAHHLSGAFDRGVGRASVARRVVEFQAWIGLVHYYVLNGALFAPGRRSVLAVRGRDLVDSYLTLLREK